MMNFTHLHLVLNHVPVIGTVFGIFFLLVGILWRSKPVTLTALLTFVVAAIATVPVYLTGESAEDAVGMLPGVTETLVGQHESAALLSLVLVALCGVSSVVALFLMSSVSARLVGSVLVWTLILSLLTGLSMVRTANLGGEIRHTEIRSGAQPAPPAGEKRYRADDDD